MAVAHSTITDPNIHEPKGVAAASADQLYHANGAGSGTWEFHDYLVTLQLADIGTAGSTGFCAPFECEVTSIQVTILAAASTAATNVTSTIAGVSITDGSITIASSASTETVHTAIPTGSNIASSGNMIKITTDGGTAGTVPATILVTIKRRA